MNINRRNIELSCGKRAKPLRSFLCLCLSFLPCHLKNTDTWDMFYFCFIRAWSFCSSQHICPSMSAQNIFLSIFPFLITRRIRFRNRTMALSLVPNGLQQYEIGEYHQNITLIEKYKINIFFFCFNSVFLSSSSW